jgi:nucleoside-diphosphate-sugar epimerase
MVLVPGGLGFIGQNLKDRMPCETYDLKEGKDIRKPIMAKPHNKVVHLAVAGYKLANENPKLAVDTNITGTLNVLEYCRENDADIIFTSTQGVYGPKTGYTVSKMMGEQLCLMYSELYGIKSVILRLGNVYGPHMEEKTTVIPKFFRMAKKGLPLTIEGDGTQSRDFVYVGDVCNAIISAFDYKKSNIFDVCSDIKTSINELAEIINSIAGNDKIKYVPMPSYRKEGKFENGLGMKRTLKELHMPPPLNLREGLTKIQHLF